MKQIYLKAIAMVCMVMGSLGMWAQDADNVTTNLWLKFNGSTGSGVQSVTYTLGDGEIAASNPTGYGWNPGVQVDTENNRLKLANGYLEAELVDWANINEKDVVTISFDLAIGYSLKDGNRDCTISAINTNGADIFKEVFNARTASRRSSTIGFTADDVYYPGNVNTDWANKTHFEIVLDYANGTITGTTTSETATNKSTTKTIPMDGSQKVAIKSIKLESGDMSNIDHTNLLANVKVTTTKGDYSTTKTITYKYVDEDGADITAVAVAAGSTPSATPENGTLYTPEYLTSFTDEAYAFDYEYVSGGEVFTVEDDVTITLVYSKVAHPTTDVKVQYVLGDKVVKETLVAEGYPVGKSLTYWVNKYVLVDGALYETTKMTDFYQRVNDVTAEPFKETLAATDITNVVFFTEGEDVEGVSVGSTPTRASNGKEAHTSTTDAYSMVDVTTLAAGKYKIYLFAHNGNSATRTGSFNVGDEEIYNFSFGNGTNMAFNSEEIVVKKAGTLSFGCTGSSSAGVDYFYIVKVGDVVSTATIGATGYTTFASASALDLDEMTEGVVAYYAASADDNAVILEPATGVVAANTGLILAGEAGTEVEIAVADVEGETIEGNLLVGCAEGATEVKGANLYVLVNNEGTAEFQSLADNAATIPAGKAYLKLENEGKSRLSISFGEGDATAIEAVEKANAADGIIYNIAGQRVQNPVKGIYIVNGKKVLVK